jgi:hypothetical protein
VEQTLSKSDVLKNSTPVTSVEYDWTAAVLMTFLLTASGRVIAGS